MDENKARQARDVAIECMGRLNETVATVQESCSEAFFKRYRLACAKVMGGIGEVINAAVRTHSKLNPSEEEWAGVASQRRTAAPPPGGLLGKSLVQFEIETVEAHVQTLRAEGSGELKAALDDIEAQMPSLKAVLQHWEPRLKSL